MYPTDQCIIVYNTRESKVFYQLNRYFILPYFSIKILFYPDKTDKAVILTCSLGYVRILMQYKTIITIMIKALYSAFVYKVNLHPNNI